MLHDNSSSHAKDPFGDAPVGNGGGTVRPRTSAADIDGSTRAAVDAPAGGCGRPAPKRVVLSMLLCAFAALITLSTLLLTLPRSGEIRFDLPGGCECSAPHTKAGFCNPAGLPEDADGRLSYFKAVVVGEPQLVGVVTDDGGTFHVLESPWHWEYRDTRDRPLPGSILDDIEANGDHYVPYCNLSKPSSDELRARVRCGGSGHTHDIEPFLSGYVLRPVERATPVPPASVPLPPEQSPDDEAARKHDDNIRKQIQEQNTCGGFVPPDVSTPNPFGHGGASPVSLVYRKDLKRFIDRLAELILIYATSGHERTWWIPDWAADWANRRYGDDDDEEIEQAPPADEPEPAEEEKTCGHAEWRLQQRAQREAEEEITRQMRKFLGYPVDEEEQDLFDPTSSADDPPDRRPRMSALDLYAAGARSQLPQAHGSVGALAASPAGAAIGDPTAIAAHSLSGAGTPSSITPPAASSAPSVSVPAAAATSAPAARPADGAQIQSASLDRSIGYPPRN